MDGVVAKLLKRGDSSGISVWEVLSHRTNRHHCARGSIPVGIIVQSLMIARAKLVPLTASL
jgi:hypothetical protein